MVVMHELTSRDLTILLGLLTATTALLALAPRTRIPYPILLVLGGLALGFAPGIPDFELPPQLAAVVHRCLEIDPAHRPQGADELCVALEPFSGRHAMT